MKNQYPVLKNDANQYFFALLIRINTRPPGCESSNGKLSCQVLGCADWASNSKHALINNCDASTHVFGDIAGVCPSEMMTKANRKIAVTVTLLNFGVFVCSNDFQCNY